MSSSEGDRRLASGRGRASGTWSSGSGRGRRPSSLTVSSVELTSEQAKGGGQMRTNEASGETSQPTGGRNGTCSVEIIDFTDAGAMTRLTSAKLDDLVTVNHTQPGNRIYLVRDVTPALKEHLHTTFGIKRAFFEWHARPLELQRSDPNWDSDFLSVCYAELRFFPNREVADLAKETISGWSVRRDICIDCQLRNLGSETALERDHCLGLIGRKVSVWSRKVQGAGWMGVVLADPSLEEGCSLWNGYGSIYRTPALQEAYTSSSTDRPPLLERLVASLMQNVASENAQLAADPEFITSRAHQFLFSEILMTLQYAFTSVFQIELDLEHSSPASPDTPSGLSPQATTLPSAQPDPPPPERARRALDQLRKWEIRLGYFHGWARDAVVAIEGRYGLTVTTGLLGDGIGEVSQDEGRGWRSGVRMDYFSLVRRIEVLKERAEAKGRLAVLEGVTAEEDSWYG